MPNLEQLETLINLGACSLNGKPARVEWGKRPIVVTQDGQDRAVFNLSVLTKVIVQHGGRFRTREPRRFACV